MQLHGAVEWFHFINNAIVVLAAGAEMFSGIPVELIKL